MLAGSAFAQETGAQDSGTGARRGRGQNGGAGRMKRMDADNDGKISRAEWKGKPEAFARLDKNSDGFITRDELAESRRGRLAEMDTNNDGKISRAEWKGKPGAFSKLDANNDGELSEDELKAARKKNRQ